jgi:HPr kinase/phosphorylase
MSTEKQQGPHVEDLLEAEDLRLELVAGSEGLSRSVSTAEVQRPGLALAGYLSGVKVDRIQLLGAEELSFIEADERESAEERVRALCALEPPCLVVADDSPVPAALLKPCDELAVPLLSTSLPESRFSDQLQRLLGPRLGATCTTHGVLVDVYGVGVLLLGKSGIGKSEVALDLVLRGHMLVADDIVELRRGAGALFGSGPELIKHHIEIRGLGILNIKDLFGIAAVRDSKRVDLVVELSEWSEREEYERLGVDQQATRFLEVEVPLIRLPVRPGRNMSTIIEVAARNQLLKKRGHFSAREFQDRLVRAIAEGRTTMVVNTDVE